MPPWVSAIVIVILLLSVIIHEVMHGVAAKFFGDHTAENAGRLTLNPLPHIDPIGSILMPLLAIVPAYLTGTTPGFFLAWAKPVPINPLHFNNIRLGELVVALAGVTSNIVIAVVAAILFHTTGNLFFPYWSSILTSTVVINLSLAIFNLLPIPPLDGSKVLGSLLPARIEYQYQQLERYGFVILLVLLFSPVGRTIFLLVALLINFFRGLLGV